jgi:signal peptide peptidase SppA
MPNLLSMLPPGPYAIYEPAACRLWDMLGNIDLHVHMSEYRSDQKDEARRVETHNSFQGDDQRNKRKPYAMSGGVAVISIEGPMSKGGAPSLEEGCSTVQIRRQIRQAVSDPDVTAIAILVDSPGGTVAGCADLAADVKSAADSKPTYAYIEDMGASAAYYVASQCNQIYANSSALVGSIGTFGMVMDSSAMAEKVGLRAHMIRSGQHKGVGAPGVAVTDENVSEMQKMVDTFASQFVSAVNKGRNLSLKAGDDVADGRVFVGTQARQKGLVDGITSFDNMLAKLRAFQPSK